MTLSREERQHRRDADLRAELRRFKPIVLRMATHAGRAGSINVGSVKRHMLARGLYLMHNDQGYRARFFGRVMIAAGLAKVGEKHRTPRSLGGNWAQGWTLPEWATERARRSTRRAA
jgi:hypothetical protein